MEFVNKYTIILIKKSNIFIYQVKIIESKLAPCRYKIYYIVVVVVVVKKCYIRIYQVKLYTVCLYDIE